jgi:hypothetical protein
MNVMQTHVGALEGVLVLHNVRHLGGDGSAAGGSANFPPPIGASSELYLNVSAKVVHREPGRNHSRWAGATNPDQHNRHLDWYTDSKCDNRVEPGYPHEKNLRAQRSVASSCHHIDCGCDKFAT